MKLKNIYFDAFKSLLNTKFEIFENCIGFVGTNESGKSNVLEAIHVLGGERELQRLDTPKMAKENNPCLRFDFELEKNEKSDFLKDLKKWEQDHTTINKSVFEDIGTIQYIIVYNKTTNQEERTFDINGIKIQNECLILNHDKISDPIYKIFHKDSLIPINKAIIINKSDINKNNESLLELEKINIQITNLRDGLKEPHLENQNEVINTQEVVNEPNENPVEENNNIKEGLKLDKIDHAEINKNQTKLDYLLEKKIKLEQLYGGFNLNQIISNTESEIVIGQEKQTAIKDQLVDLQNRIEELERIPELEAT